MRSSDILGLNARGQLYSYKYNKSKGKTIAGSKIKTFKTLKKHDIPTPEIIKYVTKPKSILEIEWDKLPNSFVIKPSMGLGGDGIIVLKKRSKDKTGWVATDRKVYRPEDLRLHILEILEGAYSMHNKPGAAIIQEYVGRHKAFRKYAYRGTPDIRVIVFNNVPVMAMLRLPTKDSKGRANLHQGAIGVGVDITTGVTTHAIWYGEYIQYKPGTKRKLHGIKIPQWTKILDLAVQTSVVTGLGFAGADIVLHPEKGPMILEINSQPGFSIQLANKKGLRKHLERVEGLKVRDIEHGVHIGKALFASNFSHRVAEKDKIRVTNIFEEVTLKGINTKRQRKKVTAKIDTGAWRTSIDYKIAEELGLLKKENIYLTRRVRSSLGIQERPIIGLTLWLKGKKIKTYASVAKRDRLRYQIIIGRRDLAGFLVDPGIDINGELI